MPIYIRIYLMLCQTGIRMVSKIYISVPNFLTPRAEPEVKSTMCPLYPQLCRKRRLNEAVSRNNRIKKLAPCRCLDGHVKESYEMSMALGARP